ncbi:hypothetical protein F511_19681 [Dorcoceras hygrometricum]|uniref:Uncharacterized protein n=1 Tax=Dorcoceras hygrometricum TaxID=472368 RepID=A0A2Z7ADP8_9LAMI|nr:hypothetical protein F511_19681 [Dorcoceras hygrometricum]
MPGSSPDGGRTAAAVASIACGAWPHAAAPSPATSLDTARQGWRTAGRSPRKTTPIHGAKLPPMLRNRLHGTTASGGRKSLAMASPSSRIHVLDTGQQSRAMRGQRAGVARAHSRGDDEEGAAKRGGAVADATNCIDQIRAIALIPLLGNRGGSGSRLPARQRKNKIRPGNVQYNSIITQYEPFIGCFSGYYLAGDLRLAPTGITRRPALHARTDSPRKTDWSKSDQLAAATAAVAVEAGGGGGFWERKGAAHLGALGSTTIGKSRVAKDPIAMHTSWRSNSDIASVTSIGYTRMSASGESSTTMHRILHAWGSHPIPPPNDPKTNQYNQDLGLIHSTNGNHLERSNEGSSIDHQVTIYLHAQNITMFPTNETWYFTSQILVSSSGGLILILTAQSTRNVFRIHREFMNTRYRKRQCVTGDDYYGHLLLRWDGFFLGYIGGGFRLNGVKED